MSETQLLMNPANPFNEQIVDEHFVGREAALAIFRTNLAGLAAGRPNHIYVSGIHGTGKTAYLSKLVEISSSESLVAVLSTLDTGVTAHQQVGGIVRRIIVGIESLNSPKSGAFRGELLTDWDQGPNSKLFLHPRRATIINDELRQDFQTLEKYVRATNRNGVVICIDEGQRIEPAALSGLKNALQALGSYLVVLSLRISSDTRGAVKEGRVLLEERASAAEGDIGAARFFVTGTSMGPFSDDDEVMQFFDKRMAYKTVQFSRSVAAQIGMIADRVPRKMVNFAAELYNRALSNQVEHVDMKLFDDTFRDYFADEMKQVVDLCTDASEDTGSILKTLAVFTQPAAAQEMLDHCFPTCSADMKPLVMNSVQGQLDRLCLCSSFVQKIEDRYCLASNVYRYALKIGLNRTST